MALHCHLAISLVGLIGAEAGRNHPAVALAWRLAEESEGGALGCVVEDDGPGMPHSDVRARAFGLQAVRRRLAFESPRRGTRSIAELRATVTGGAS